jgi:hypothetical protein
MIDISRSGEVNFIVPDSLAAMGSWHESTRRRRPRAAARGAPAPRRGGHRRSVVNGEESASPA